MTRAPGQGGAGLRSVHEQLAHVRQVEQAAPLADRAMLVEDAAVLDRHEPAAELDEPCPERGVARRQRCLEGRGLGLGHEASSDGSDRRAERLRDQGAFALERQDRARLIEPDPADLVELVVVVRQVAADRLHQEVVDGLVDAPSGLGEVVFDRIERAGDAAYEPGLLGHFAQGRLLVVSPTSGVPLGSVQVRPSRSRRRLPTTSHGCPPSYRTTIPPAEVAVEPLSRATAPTRRSSA